MKEEWKMRPYLGVLPLVLSAEQSLLGAEDLDCGRGVLGQVGERTRVRDEAGAHDVADESREVGSNLMRDLGVDRSAAWFGMCGAEGSCRGKQKRALVVSSVVCVRVVHVM